MPFLQDSGAGVSVPIGGGGLGHGFEHAPDGNTYFAVLGPSINLVQSIRNIIEAERIYLSYPQGRGRDQAAALEVIRRELETAVHASGIATAEFAEERAKSLLERRIVRPATPGSHHLKDGIIARAIRSAGMAGSWGAVGVGDISALDAYPYWKAQEFGSQHLVGEELRGYFFHPGGPTAAGRAPSRSQAVFGVTGAKGPKMLVQNPIQGKAFLTEATLDAMGFRYSMWRSVEQIAVAQVRSVRIATLGDLKGLKGAGTVGGFAQIARFRPGSAANLPMSFRMPRL